MSEAVAGSIKVIAGTGVAGDQGDGGPAHRAQLSSPVAMCLDDHGNIYIADANTFSVRRIDASTRIITTVAGGGDDCEDEFDPDVMMEECMALADGSQCTDAPLDVADLAFGDERLYMALQDEHRVRYVDLNTGKLHTIAGTGEPGSCGDGDAALLAQLDEPTGVCLDGRRNLFIADSQNGLIRKVDLQGATISTIAGGGTKSPCLGTPHPDAKDALISNPRKVLSLADGNLLVSSDDGVLLVEMATGIIRPFGQGLGECHVFSLGIDAMDCDDNGNIYLASSMSQSIWMISSGKTNPVRLVGSGNLGQCEQLDDLACVDLASPRGLAVARYGMLYFVDAGVYKAFVVEFD